MLFYMPYIFFIFLDYLYLLIYTSFSVSNDINTKEITEHSIYIDQHRKSPTQYGVTLFVLSEVIIIINAVILPTQRCGIT